MLPIADFLMVKGSVVMLCTGSNGIVLWGIGLDDDPPGTGAPPRPPRHLAKELKAAFTGAKVREVEDCVSGDYSH